jgi:hypothetical protein
MGSVDVYTPEEIRRRTAEFEAANHRDHARYVIGAVLVSLLFVAGVLLALADW